MFSVSVSNIGFVHIKSEHNETMAPGLQLFVFQRVP
jgi:hypothetical protein